MTSDNVTYQVKGVLDLQAVAGPFKVAADLPSSFNDHGVYLTNLPAKTVVKSCVVLWSPT